MHERMHFISLASDTHCQIAQFLVIKLQQLLSSDNTGLYGCLPHVNATLKKLLLTCNAACVVQSSCSSSVNVSFDKAQQLHLGKNGVAIKVYINRKENWPQKKEYFIVSYITVR